MTKKLDWDSLKTLNCPKCYKDLETDPKINTLLICPDKVCGFMVNKSKAREIVAEMCAKAGDDFGRADFEEMMKNP
jgi:hypothetical protein